MHHLSLAATLVALIPASALAQSYPARPIALMVPAPAGGPTDIVGRVIATRWRPLLKCRPVPVQRELWRQNCPRHRGKTSRRQN